MKTNRNPGGKERLKNNKRSQEIHKHLRTSPGRRDKYEEKYKGKYEELERKYNIIITIIIIIIINLFFVDVEIVTNKIIKKKGIRTVIEELKQRLHSKTVKLKRYEKRVNQYKIKRMFVQNQKRFYKQMDGVRKYQ